MGATPDLAIPPNTGMSGYPAAIVLADAILKNATNHGRGTAADGVPERALRQMKRTGSVEPHVNASRWIPATRAKAVSHALEVAVADECVARVAKRLGDDVTARDYSVRAHAYEAYWDTHESAFQGRLANGSFLRVPLDAYDASGRFEEGTPLQRCYGDDAAPSIFQLLRNCDKEGFILSLTNYRGMPQARISESRNKQVSWTQVLAHGPA